VLKNRQIFAACKRFQAHHLMHNLPLSLYNLSIISAFYLAKRPLSGRGKRPLKGWLKQGLVSNLLSGDG
jgi:hypothetical protein